MSAGAVHAAVKDLGVRGRLRPSQRHRVRARDEKGRVAAAVLKADHRSPMPLAGPEHSVSNGVRAPGTGNAPHPERSAQGETTPQVMMMVMVMAVSRRG